MPAHDLIGSYVRILYHSAFAPHVMTLPAHGWNGSDTSLDPGTFDNWNATTQPGDTMITNFIDKIKVIYNSDVTFDQAEIWTRVSMSVEPRLRFIQSLAVSGTGTLTGWSEAVQKTFFLRDASNNALKLIPLDTPTDNLFGKYFTLNTDETALVGELTLSTNAWATRAGNKPEFFRSLTITLNERLRREYHLR